MSNEVPNSKESVGNSAGDTSAAAFTTLVFYMIPLWYKLVLQS
jgi:hypothetical protein